MAQPDRKLLAEWSRLAKPPHNERDEFGFACPWCKWQSAEIEPDEAPFAGKEVECPSCHRSFEIADVEIKLTITTKPLPTSADVRYLEELVERRGSA